MKIKVHLKEEVNLFKIKLEEQTNTFETIFGDSVNIIVKPVENYYDGSYDVIPSINEQVLKTAQKTMKQNLTVNAIPYSVTTNLTGGKTATIA